MPNMPVSTVGSYKIIALLTDCDGTPVTPSQVSDVKIKISEYLDPETVVDGYNLYSLGTTGMSATLNTDSDGFVYNWSANPYHDGKAMFPKHETAYLVEIVWYDQNGNPYAGPVIVDSL